MLLKLMLLVIVICVIITEDKGINARSKLRAKIAAKMNIGKKLTERRQRTEIGDGSIRNRRLGHIHHIGHHGRGLVISIVSNISNILGLVINILVNLLGAVGRSISVLITLFAHLNEQNVIQIEITIKSLVDIIAEALQSATTSISDVAHKLKNCQQLSLMDKKKLLIDINSVLSNLDMFKIKIQSGLNAGKSAYIRSTGSVKVRVKEIVKVLTTQMAQIDTQISSAIVVHNILDGDDNVTGSSDTFATNSDSIDYISTEANIVSNILIKLLDGVKEKVDQVITLYANSNEGTALQIETIVTDIAGFVPKALISITMHLANIKLKFDSGVQLTMGFKQKLYSDMSLILNNLLAAKNKFQLGVDVSGNVISSQTVSSTMKMKAYYTSATFTAQIAQIEILVSTATYLCSAINIGLIEKDGIKTSVVRIASDERVKESSKTLSDAFNALRELLDQLLSYINSDDYNNTMIFVTQLSRTASNTWILIRISLRNIEGKLISELNDNDKNKYIADIDALLKILLTIRIRFDQGLKAANKAYDRSSKQNKLTVHSAVSELRDGLAQIELIIYEANNMSDIVNSDAFDLDEDGDGSDVSTTSGPLNVTSLDNTSIGTESTSEETFSEDKAPENEWKTEKSATDLINDLNSLRTKIDDLLNSLKNNEFDKATRMITRLAAMAANTWISIAKYSTKIEITLSSSGTDLKELDQKKFNTELTILLKDLSSLKLRFEKVLKSGNETADKAPKTSKLGFNMILAALKTVIEQIEARIYEVNRLLDKLNPNKMIVPLDTADNSTIKSSVSVVGEKVGQLVILFSSELTNKRVNQIEDIFADLKIIISTSVKSVNKIVNNIKNKLKASKQLKDSEKLEMSSNITSVLSILINFKPKIELALNAAIKSSTKNPGSFKTKADAFLLTLRTQIIYIDTQIAQAIQLQINLNGNVSTEAVTEESKEDTSDDYWVTEKISNTQIDETAHTADIETLGDKVDVLIKGLNNRDFNQIEDIVNQLKGPALKALNSVTLFITEIRSRATVANISLSDKTKCLGHITSLLKSLLAIKIKCVLVLKATNEAATKATGTVKTNIDNYLSIFSTQMALIEAKITEVLQIQFKLNGGRRINFEYETETKQTVNVKGSFKGNKSGNGTVHFEESVSD